MYILLEQVPMYRYMYRLMSNKLIKWYSSYLNNVWLRMYIPVYMSDIIVCKFGFMIIAQ